MNSDFESVFQLKLEVRNVRRPVWRRFQVPSTQTFWDLHCTIQNLLDFDFGTDFVFHVHTAEGHLKTFAIDEEAGYFAPNPQVAWLFRIGDHFSSDGIRRMDYLHDAVFAPWVCSIDLESSLPREVGVRYPRCIAGEGAVFESNAGTLGFNEAVETGRGLPRGFDPDFFDPAAVQFDDSWEEQMWTTFLAAEMMPELVMEVYGRVCNGVDLGDNHLVPMPAPYYDLLLKQKLLRPAEVDAYNPADPLHLVPVWFSKASLRRLARDLKERKSHEPDPVLVRRLASVRHYISYLNEGLKNARPMPKGSRPWVRSGNRMRRLKWAAFEGTPGFVPPDAACPITLAAGIWRVDKEYDPVLICRRKDTGGQRFIAAKMPATVRQQPANAAMIAQLDLLQAAAEREPPETDMDARLFAISIGYGVMPFTDMSEVAPVDTVLEWEADIDEKVRALRPEVEGYIRADDPPIVRETFDRLVRAGYSGKDATDLICRAFLSEFIRQVGEQPDIESILRALSRLPDFPDDPSR